MKSKTRLCVKRVVWSEPTKATAVYFSLWCTGECVATRSDLHLSTPVRMTTNLKCASLITRVTSQAPDSHITEYRKLYWSRWAKRSHGSWEAEHRPLTSACGRPKQVDPHEFEVILMYILNSKTKEKEVTAFVTVERCCWHPACVGP